MSTLYYNILLYNLTPFRDPRYLLNRSFITDLIVDSLIILLLFINY